MEESGGEYSRMEAFSTIEPKQIYNNSFHLKVEWEWRKVEGFFIWLHSCCFREPKQTLSQLRAANLEMRWNRMVTRNGMNSV